MASPLASKKPASAGKAAQARSAAAHKTFKSAKPKPTDSDADGGDEVAPSPLASKAPPAKGPQGSSNPVKGTPFSAKVPQNVPSDGRSDSVPAMVKPGSVVVPSDVVSALGRGSSDAGHQTLMAAMPHMVDGGMAAGPVKAPSPLHVSMAGHAPALGHAAMPHMADGGMADPTGAIGLLANTAGQNQKLGIQGTQAQQPTQSPLASAMGSVGNAVNGTINGLTGQANSAIAGGQSALASGAGPLGVAKGIVGGLGPQAPVQPGAAPGAPATPPSPLSKPQGPAMGQTGAQPAMRDPYSGQSFNVPGTNGPIQSNPHLSGTSSNSLNPGDPGFGTPTASGGSSQAGFGMFPQGQGFGGSNFGQGAGGGIPTMLSQGEHVIPPSGVASMGGGDPLAGTQALQQMMQGIRNQANGQNADGSSQQPSPLASLFGGALS